MKTIDKERIFAALCGGPVCKTWRGCVERTKHLSAGDLMFLTTYFDCDVDEVARKMYHERRRIEARERVRRMECPD